MRFSACLLALLAVTACGKSSPSGGTCPPPTISFRNPMDGQSVNGPVPIQLDVAGQCPIAEVDVSANGMSIAKMTATPYSTLWDTTSLPNGNYTIDVVATDNAGDKGEASIEVTTVQPCMPGQPCPPKVTLLAPARDATVCGKVALYAEAVGHQGTPVVTFLADGAPIGSLLMQGPYLIQWDTSSVAPGAHTVEADAVDDSGLMARYSLKVTVAAPGQCTPQGPVIAFACPPPDPLGHVSCVTGKTTLCADVDDSVSVSSVTYGVGGVPLSGMPSGPQWDLTWDTTILMDGVYQLQANATDNQGLKSTDPRSFQVDNHPPTISLTQPTGGTMVNVGMPVTFAATASDGMGCGIAQVAYAISGPASAMVTATMTPFSASWDSSGQPPGMYTVTATATDRAGFTATSSGMFTLVSQ